MSEEKIGACFEGIVQDLASDGRGIIVHPSGRRFFVGGVAHGEKVRAKISQLKGRVGFADCEEVLSPSDARIDPRCSHHGFDVGQCGACPWQFMRYDEQLLRKQERVAREFKRLGYGEKVKSIIPSPKTFGYRNRAQFKSDGKKLGYVSAASHQIAPIEDCPILTEKNRRTLADLRATLPNPQWHCDKKSAQKKQWTSIDINDSVSLETVSVNKRLPFRQANDDQNDAMKAWLQSKLSAMDKSKGLIELFCGSGNLTEVIAAEGFAKVLCVEGVQESLDKLAQRNFDGLTTKRANLFLEEEVAKIFNKKSLAEILVLDPPRDGLKARAAITNKNSKIKDIFYVSCDLATLVRDAADFIQHKFRVIEVQALDQFPHTPHIELLLHLRR